MDWESGKTPYDILELKNGPEATDAEIRKVRGVDSMVVHPSAHAGVPSSASPPCAPQRVPVAALWTWPALGHLVLAVPMHPVRHLPGTPPHHYPAMQAYKLLALKKHPDKNKDNPNAAAEFGELEKAYRVLTDASARGALDDYLA